MLVRSLFVCLRRVPHCPLSRALQGSLLCLPFGGILWSASTAALIRAAVTSATPRPRRRLLRESALLAQLQRCATWDELRMQLQRYAEQGKLTQLAERLLPPAMSAAAAAAAGQHPSPDVPSRKRLRARAPIKYEEGAGEEDTEEDGQRPAKRHKPDGQAAVGQCVEVRWLLALSEQSKGSMGSAACVHCACCNACLQHAALARLIPASFWFLQVWLGEGSSRQPYTGLVVERIPSG